MIASAVDTRKTGFFALARRRSTELRRPAISREGSRPSKGSVFRRGNTSTSTEGSRAWITPPSRSALLSSSQRKTRPSRPDFSHCSSRCSASMPSGDEEATAEREALLSGRLLVELVLFELLLFVFIAPVVARAFLVGANVYPTLFRK